MALWKIELEVNFYKLIAQKNWAMEVILYTLGTEDNEAGS